MKRLFAIFCAAVLLFCGCSVKVVPAPAQTTYTTPKQSAPKQEERKGVLLSPGDEFQENDYIEFAGQTVKYVGYEDDQYVFSITNDTEYFVCLSVSFVGVKKDGTYDFIGMPAFSGNDEKQYEKDLKENGWAVMKTKMGADPAETLTMYMTVFDFGEGYVSFDPDNDGYYDLMFTAYPQEDPDSYHFSSSAPNSEIYKLKVK